MRHDWDYSVYGTRPRDMLVKGRRVCRNCGREQKKFDKQCWQRVVGYHWSPTVGRCGPMTKKDFKPGDLVEDDRGRRWIVSRYMSWSGTYIHGGPATKKGERDKRYEGQYLNPAGLKLIKRLTEA